MTPLQAPSKKMVETMSNTPHDSEVQPANARDAAVPPAAVSFGQALRFWFKLGLISFGGPAGQIAIMQSELVDRRRWISSRRFLHALNYCMLLPGPEAQQLATYIGWLLHGTWGGIVAGALFVLPSAVLLWLLSWAYMQYGDLSWVQGILYGVKPVVVAIVLTAVGRIGSRAIHSAGQFALAAAAFVVIYFDLAPFPLVVLAAGLIGYFGSRFWPTQFAAAGGHGGGHGDKPGASTVAAVIDDHHELPAHLRSSRSRFLVHLALGLCCWGAPLAALYLNQGTDGTHTRMGIFFTQAALVTFGGAYAVLPYVRDQAVEHFGWLEPGQMIDGLALGESTPGPLIMVVAFVGFVGAWQQSSGSLASATLGLATATYFTFLPSFLFILLGAPLIEATRGQLRLGAALSGITAAVVGVVLSLAVTFGRDVLFPAEPLWSAVGGIDLPALGLVIAAYLALWRWKWDVLRVVLLGALAGLGLHAALG